MNFFDFIKKAKQVIAITLTMTILSVWISIWVKSAQTEGLDRMVLRSDFRAVVTGARIIADGNGALFYDLRTQYEVQSRLIKSRFQITKILLLPYNHLPFEAIAVSPLMILGLSYPVIFGMWTALSVVAAGFSLWLMNRVMPMPKAAVLVFALASCSYGPMLRSMILGQNSPLVLLGICGTFAALKYNLQAWAGAILCLAALKPQMLPFLLLLLLLERKWLAILTFGGGLVVLSLMVVPLLGVAWPLQYCRLLMEVANWPDINAINPSIMHNWRGLATNLFKAWAPSLITPVFVSLSVASLGVIAWTWWRWGSHQSERQREVPNSQNDPLWALVAVLAVLTSPHSNPHDLTLLLFPAWIVMATILRRNSSGWSFVLWSGVLWSAYLLNTIGDPTTLVVPSVLLLVLAVGLIVIGIERQSNSHGNIEKDTP